MIAIIGVLSSVVLASVRSARTKGADAAVKENLIQIRSAAELYYEANLYRYLDVCTQGATAGSVTSVYPSVLAAAQATGGQTATVNTVVAVSGSDGVATCHSNGTKWAAEAPLKSPVGAFFCVDSTGFSDVVPEGSTLGVGDSSCK